jgi:hypothetical protein
MIILKEFLMFWFITPWVFIAFPIECAFVYSFTKMKFEDIKFICCISKIISCFVLMLIAIMIRQLTRPDIFSNYYISIAFLIFCLIASTPIDLLVIKKLFNFYPGISKQKHKMGVGIFWSNMVAYLLAITVYSFIFLKYY